MKKIVRSLAVLFAGVLILTGCQSNDNAGSESGETAESSTVESTVSKISVTVKIENDGEEIDSKELEVEEDATLLEILEENHEVEAPEGFISAIDGIAQDEANGLYWTFTINGDWGEKGAAETILNDGDEVVFSYGKV